jgi:hypothetical protein
MTGAIEFLRKAKAICESRTTCVKCPVDDMCLCGINNMDDGQADLVRKVMDYQIKESSDADRN